MKKQTKKNLFNIAMASAVVTGSVVALAPAEAQAAGFKDVKADNSHFDNIMNLVERNKLKGYTDGTFKAGQPVTRAHAALIIANVLGLDTKNVTDPGFKDVPKTHDYYGAIAALANKGYIKGFPDGTYGINETLTRGQMAVILKNAFELEGQAQSLPFIDAKGHAYESHVSTLFANGVTAGVTPSKFGLADKVTRGQLATFVVKAEIASPEKVVDIKDGQLITTKGTYAIDADLAKVFNADNAAALKGAKIELEEETTAFASLRTFVAAETSKLKLKSLTIVATGATFDAGGYTIPNVTVNGTNVVVKNVIVTEKITVAEGLTVELAGVEAKEIAIQGDTKLKLDATTKIEKLQVPAGKKLEDVISNFEEVKDIVENIVVVDEKGEEVKPETPTTPPVIPPVSGPTNLANTAYSDAQKLVNALFDGVGAAYNTYAVVSKGTPTIKNSASTETSTGSNTTFDFNANYKLADIKNAVPRATLKAAVIDNVVDAVADINNPISTTNIANIDSIFVGQEQINTASITSENYISQLTAALTTDKVADLLIDITGLNHDAAKDLTVAQYIDGGNKASEVLKITFDDGSSLEYAIVVTK